MTTPDIDEPEPKIVDPPLSEIEVRRRVPSLQYIDHKRIEAEVIHLSKFAPPYFWTRPGSTNGYHNAHRHGLWSHTLQLSPVIDRLADSWVEQNHIRESDIDMAHAAAILHDQLKAGPESDVGDNNDSDDGDDDNNPPQTKSDHDLLMGERIREQSQLPAVVARAVESHMGGWYDGPKPTTGSLEDLIHCADMMASADSLPLPVPEPVPEELDPYVEGVEIE